MQTRSVVATEDVALGASGDRMVSTLVLQGEDGAGGAFVGNVVLEARIEGSDFAFVPIPYKQRSLNAAVSDDATAVAAITDQPFLIEADVAGLEVQLAVTYTSGELDLSWKILHG